MKLILICLVSALLTIWAESSILSAQGTGGCPRGSTPVGVGCYDFATGPHVGWTVSA